MSDVKSSIALTSDGRLQGSIGGSSTNLAQIRIKSIQCQSSAADGEVKIYDNTAASGVIKIHLKWGTAANEPLTMNFDGDGVRFETAAYVDVTNCDFVVAYYNQETICHKEKEHTEVKSEDPQRRKIKRNIKKAVT